MAMRSYRVTYFTIQEDEEGHPGSMPVHAEELQSPAVPSHGAIMRFGASRGIVCDYYTMESLPTEVEDVYIRKA